ncbi:MAG TPA: SH3 domain-containing protein [Nocardioidaceae bacterium]|nr:SH3 domain-containing protein [Nocardioidaceae bacterium]
MIHVARSRHKHVLRKPLHRRILNLALPTLGVLAVAAPATAVVWPDPEPVESTPMTTAEPVVIRPTPVPMRVAPISRSEPRVRLEEKPPEVVDHKFATAPLNVRTAPSKDARILDVLDWASKIAVTGERRGKWAEIVRGEESRWVTAAYLAEKKPKPEPEPEEKTEAQAEPEAAPEPAQAEEAPAEPATTGLSSAPCASGSDVESGLVANAIAVHRAVCAAFPEVTSYGGVRAGDDGYHGSGQALDIMITGSAGDQIAEFVRSHAAELGVSEVIWSQRIWTVQRSSEGWRWMEDRGSTTANHYDHVHVSVY